MKKVRDIKRVVRKIKRSPAYKKDIGIMRGVFRTILALEKNIALVFVAFFMMVFSAESFIAFEAHVVNVEAEIRRIDPPFLNDAGGYYIGSALIGFHGDDPDGGYIYYTVTPGTSPEYSPDPVCGDTFGGPVPVESRTIINDSVVKVIVCDGTDEWAHKSAVTTEIYRIEPIPEEDPFAPQSLVDEGGDLPDENTLPDETPPAEEEAPPTDETPPEEEVVTEEEVVVEETIVEEPPVEDPIPEETPDENTGETE